MKQYTLEFYANLSYFTRIVTAYSVEIKDRCLVFTDDAGNLVAVYPSQITAITSVKSITKQEL
jgi:hypothetical protein